MADREELPDVAAGDGPATEARPAGDGEARHGELDQGLELGGLLGGALAEKAHGSLAAAANGGVRGWCCGGELLMARLSASYTGHWIGALCRRDLTCLWTTEFALDGQACAAADASFGNWVVSKFCTC